MSKYGKVLAALENDCYVLQVNRTQPFLAPRYRAYQDGRVVNPQAESCDSPMDALATLNFTPIPVYTEGEVREAIKTWCVHARLLGGDSMAGWIIKLLHEQKGDAR